MAAGWQLQFTRARTHGLRWTTLSQEIATAPTRSQANYRAHFAVGLQDFLDCLGLMVQGWVKQGIQFQGPVSPKLHLSNQKVFEELALRDFRAGAPKSVD